MEGVRRRQFLPVVTGEPDPAVFRKSLWKHFNQGQHTDPLDPAEARANRHAVQSPCVLNDHYSVC